MIRFEFTIEIERPPAEVWSLLTDPERLPEWQSSAISAHQVSAGPLGQGTQIEDERRFLGRRVSSRVEVVAYEPVRVFTLLGKSGPLPFEIRHRLEPHTAGTRLSIEAKADPPGLSRLAAPLAARAAEREFRSDFRRLKALLEATPPA